jgi:hypothetical protein
MTFKALASAVFLTLLGLGVNAEDKPEEKLWFDTYDARERYFESAVGPLPKDIVKMRSMAGAWPGGGLYVIPAPKIGANLAVYTTSGLTNSDMPTDVRMVGFKLDSDGKQVAGRLKKKTRARQPPGAAGYGYELMVIAPKGVDWPLMVLQWAVNEELVNDIGLLEKVDCRHAEWADALGVQQRGGDAHAQRLGATNVHRLGGQPHHAAACFRISAVWLPAAPKIRNEPHPHAGALAGEVF